MSRLNVNTIYPRTGDEIAVSGNLNVSGTFKAYQFETMTSRPSDLRRCSTIWDPTTLAGKAKSE